MNAEFLGIPGKLKTLLVDRLTAARAALLDNLSNLDAAISTRAAASTALSNTTWTATKAGYLDQAISSLPASAIKSIQSDFLPITVATVGTGEDLKYVDVTITSVDTAKCFVSFVGGSASGNAGNCYIKSGSGTTSVTYMCSARLTTSTNLRISSPQNDALAPSIAGRWTVIEYI